MFVEIDGYGRFRQRMAVEEEMSALRRDEMGGKGFFLAMWQRRKGGLGVVFPSPPPLPQGGLGYLWRLLRERDRSAIGLEDGFLIGDMMWEMNWVAMGMCFD